MTEEEYKKYMKGVLNTTKMISTEAIGYGIAGKIASSVDSSLGTSTASNVLSTGSSFAGMPSLVYSAGTVMNSLKMLEMKKKRK